jgi:hypothetical protein
MLMLAFRYNHQFAMSDSNRWVFVLTPLLGAVGVAVLTVVGARLELKRRVVITAGALVYDEGDEEKNFQVPWKSLAYSLPMGKKQMVRTLLVAAADKTARIHDIFMPGFDKLAAEIRNRKTRAITVGGNAGNSIESGKVGSIDPALLGRRR